jgi:3-oxoadipate enol-lactonase
MKGSYLSDGSTLAFHDSGRGLPVVFLHPTPLDHDYWRPLSERLTEVRAIAPDLRGHGSSELGTSLPVGGFGRVPDAQVLTMAQLASDVQALVDHLQLPRAVFAGCSIGGYVLLELWRRARDRVRGLAFVCAKPQPDTEANLIRRAETIGRARAGEVMELLDGMARSLVGASAQAAQPSIVSEVRAQMTVGSEALIAIQAGLAARPDSVPTVETIDVPVLAIAGGQDVAVSPADMEAFRSTPGGCEYHLLPDAGHFAAYEQPEMISALLSGWLRRFPA